MSRAERFPADEENCPLALNALAAFGERRQMLALAEELSEASAAVSRYLNAKGDLREVRFEVVDVESVIESLREVLGSDEEWALAREEKRVKLTRILETGEARTR